MGINDGTAEGSGVRFGDCAMVEILVGFNEGITKSAGFDDVGIEVDTTVGWRVRIVSWVEHLC